MVGPDRVGQVTVKELNQRLQGEKGALLLDTLPAEHFLGVHLPGALNTCVFEVGFVDRVRELVPDRETEIILYGSSGSTLDAQTAADKLIREGYTDVKILFGGLSAWRKAGFALEGERAAEADKPQSKLLLTDGRRRVIPTLSTVGWRGRNPSTTHFGTVGILGGEITVHGGELSGFLEVDMQSIVNENLAGTDLRAVLEEHLKSDDFFYSKRFGTASLRIVSGKVVKTPYLTVPNVDIKAMLELRGVAGELNFQATVSVEEAGALLIEAHFDIDRTRWNLIYGSSRYFDHLGMHQVFDLISIELRVRAE